jgi:hypothetical protein
VAYKVTNYDCAVCHMEGDPATGNRTAAHQGSPGGNINLRDPDTGLEITNVAFTNAVAGQTTNAGSYAPAAGNPVFSQFSRNLGSNTLEGPVMAIMINQCLKCHDANGAAAFGAGLALNPLAAITGGNAFKPFGTTIAGAGYAAGNDISAGNVAGGVVNVYESFKTTNSSYHPILGQQNNTYTAGNRMATPWVMTKTAGNIMVANSWGFRLSCWDCHAPPGVSLLTPMTYTVTAHGAAAVNAMRGTPTPPTLAAASTTNEATLCKVCHAGYFTNAATNHGTGSAFSSGGSGIMQTYLRYGCNICHSSNYSVAVVRPVRGQDVHGVNVLPTTGVAKTTRWAFIPRCLGLG